MKQVVREKWAIALLRRGISGEPYPAFDSDADAVRCENYHGCHIALFSTEEEARRYLDDEKEGPKRHGLADLSTAKVVPVTVTVETL
jgi:hypothetical protein